jgi:hypothetical protein
MTIMIREDVLRELVDLADLGLDSRELHPDLYDEAEENVNHAKRLLGFVPDPDDPEGKILVEPGDLADASAAPSSVPEGGGDG